MLLLSMLLMTAWMFSVVLGYTAGGLSHLLVLASAAIVFMSGNGPRRSRRHSKGSHHLPILR